MGVLMTVDQKGQAGKLRPESDRVSCWGMSAIESHPHHLECGWHVPDKTPSMITASLP